MQINIKTKEYTLTPEVQAYLDDRMVAVEKLITAEPDAIVCDVELAKETGKQSGEVWRAEMNLEIAGEFYRAEAMADTMNAAIDGMQEEITRQLRRSKRKRLDMIRRGGLRMKEFLRFGRFGKK